MRRPWTRLALASAAALSLASLPATALAAPQDEASRNEATPITLDLYTLTDVHGHIQQVAKKGVVREAGLPAMNCYLKKARETNPNSSFTLLGDNIGASPYISGALNDNPTIAALNTLNPLASTIGNHELDMGQAVFKQRVDGSNPSEYVQATFPYLGANIEGMGTYGDGTPYLGDYKLWTSPSGMKVAFIGAGVSHKTLIKEFVELGAHVTLCDQKKSVEDFGDYAATIRELGIDLSLGENYLDGFKGQDIIMRTPGFVGYFEKPLQDAMAAGTMVTSEVELFFDFCPCEIVAVTGSDGKTTTTTLISKFYEAAGRKVHLGGNIGAALLPMLPEVSPDDVAVVELSSFQLISMHQSPNIAVVTNVTPNHLDHHKDMQEYIDAKRNILLYQKQPCRAVLGYENEISRSMQKDCKGKQVWFTRLHETDNGAFLREDGMLCMAENGVVTPFLAQKDVKLRGLHNIENLLAAAAAVWGEVPVEAIQLVGSNFTGVEHRIEPVRVLDGVTYYNDSIGTSPTRTIAGLRSFDQKVILIAGGYDKHIPYEPLAPEITAHVKNLVLMGATGPRIEKAVREDPNFNEAELPIQHADNMQHAVELARACAKPGDIIILSPASASFDLYPNFEVRGREFKSIVNALK